LITKEPLALAIVGMLVVTCRWTELALNSSRNKFNVFETQKANVFETQKALIDYPTTVLIFGRLVLASRYKLMTLRSVSLYTYD